MIANTLGQRIKALRLERDWTQRELAERVGLTQAAIYLHEKDLRVPSYFNIKRLARAFDVPLSVLDPDLSQIPFIDAATSAA